MNHNLKSLPFFTSLLYRDADSDRLPVLVIVKDDTIETLMKVAELEARLVQEEFVKVDVDVMSEEAVREYGFPVGYAKL